MKASSAILVAVFCLVVLPGCRGAKKDVEALERENRFLDQKNWTYISYIEDYERLLKECRAENKKLREQLGEGGGGSSQSHDSDVPAIDTDQGLEIPQVEIPFGDDVQPEEEISNESTTSHRSPRLNPPSPPKSSSRLSEEDETEEIPVGPVHLPDSSAASEVPLHTPSTDLTTLADPREVDSVAFDNFFTGGNNTDGIPGDEGITLLVETRNAQGDVIRPEGEIDISLLDPAAASESEARVGLWRLTVEEVRENFRDAAVGRGVRLDLPWQNGLPRREELRLFVRFTDANGERIQSDRPLRIELPGRTAAERRERRRRLVRSLASRRAASSHDPTQATPYATPRPDAPSAPAWQGGTTDDSQSSAGTPSSQIAQGQSPEPSSSGWSRSRRGIKTHPTPAPSLAPNGTGDLAGRSPSSQAPAASTPTRAAGPTESIASRTTEPRTATAKATPSKEVEDEPVTDEPIAIEEPTRRRSRTPIVEKKQPRTDREAKKPRPWSPYR